MPEAEIRAHGDVDAAVLEEDVGVVGRHRQVLRHAAIGGRVGLRVIDMGNLVGSGDAAGIAVITQLAPIDVEFAVQLLVLAHSAAHPCLMDNLGNIALQGGVVSEPE